MVIRPAFALGPDSVADAVIDALRRADIGVDVLTAEELGTHDRMGDPEGGSEITSAQALDQAFSPRDLREEGRRRILAALTTEWWTIAEIKAATVGDVHPRTVQYRLKELRREGLVEYKESDFDHTGRWRLRSMT
jgi:hypothetical protein